jgi:hypothetical protein
VRCRDPHARPQPRRALEGVARRAAAILIAGLIAASSLGSASAATPGAKTAPAEYLTILISGGSEYIRGDAFGLSGYLGLEPAAAARHTDEWVVLRAADPDYARFAAAVMLLTTKSILGLVAELVLIAPLSSVAPTKIHGMHVKGVRGQLLVAGGNRFMTILYARASGTKLPVAEIGRQGTASGTVNPSKWNEPLKVTPPARATPIARTGLE